jgi:cobalt-zinc-cadmium efflux system outer membrane protein
MRFPARISGALVGGFLGLHGAVALAADRPLSFVEAAERSARNPRVAAGKVAQAELERKARGLPALDANPVLSVQLGARLSPERDRGADFTASLSQTVSLERAARLRREALAAEARTAEAQAQQARLELRLDAARAWLDLWAHQKLLALAKEDEEAARRLQQAVTRLVQARERLRSEALVARRRVEEARLQVLAAEGALAESREQLRAELGLPLEDTPVASGEPPELLPPSAAEQKAALASAASLPSVRARSLLAAEERVRAAEERAARGNRLTFGVVLQREAPDANVVQGLVAVPLPLLDVASREAAPRLAAARRADGEAEDALHRARAGLSLAFHDLEHSDQVESAVRGELLPAAEEALRALDREFAAGEATLLERIDGQRALIEARARLVHALRDRAWARLRAAALLAAIREGSR